ncbi:MAG: TMEM175 family protein [Lactobacillaceae bacterium]|jgi:uncharacterized membrane protein|nr:TMEM175 family protein [Lactobacillaceae bacterium]
MAEKFDFEKGVDARRALQDRFYSKRTIERLNAFIDAVLAIVATIMVLELHVPEIGADKISDLIPVLASIVVFLISFFVVIQAYISNMRMLNVIEKISPTGVLFVFVWLATLSLLPFMTRWMVEDWHNRFAVLGYGIVYVLASTWQQVLMLNVVRTNFNPDEMDTPENNALARLYNFAFNNQAKGAAIGSVFLLIIATIWPSWGFWLFLIVPIVGLIDTIYDGELKDKIAETEKNIQDRAEQNGVSKDEVLKTIDNEGRISRQNRANQERLRNNLYWKNLPKEQRDAARKRYEDWQNMSPEQRQEVRQKMIEERNEQKREILQQRKQQREQNRKQHNHK